MFKILRKIKNIKQWTQFKINTFFVSRQAKLAGKNLKVKK